MKSYQTSEADDDTKTVLPVNGKAHLCRLPMQDSRALVSVWATLLKSLAKQ
jgi:hypothetical protein